MTSDELLEALRVRLDDAASPYLWSDDELLGYLDQAHEEAAIRGRLIPFDTRDTTPVIAPTAIVAGTSEYAMDSKVIEVRRILVDAEPVGRTSDDLLDQFYGPEWESDTGTPTSVILRRTTLRLYPTPVAAGTLHMQGFRLPQGQFLTGEILEPEIPPEEHYHLLDWASHMAYLKPDAETVNAQRADLFEARFEQRFGARFSANEERKRHETRSKTVRYAGYWP